MNIFNSLFNSQQSTYEYDPLADTQPLNTYMMPLCNAVQEDDDHLIRLEYGVSTHQGQRESNQDAGVGLMLRPEVPGTSHEFSIFMVADGLGGMPGGDEASTYTVQSIMRVVMAALAWPDLHGRLTDKPAPDAFHLLRTGVETAHHTVERKTPGGGTTVTAALVLDRTAYVAHVGDSRAYFIHGGEITPLTTDHTLVQMLLEQGHLDEGDIEDHPKRHVLSQAVGRSSNLNIEFLAHELTSPSHLLLCSDGVWNPLTDEQIVSIVESSASAQYASKALVHTAIEAGGSDNATALVVRIW